MKRILKRLRGNRTMMLLVIGGILLIIAGTGSWLWGRYIADVDTADKRRECPDKWHEGFHRPHFTVVDSEHRSGEAQRQHFVIDGERVEYREMDVEWVEDNCPVDEPTRVD